MQYKTKTRLSGVILLVAFPVLWFIPTYSVFCDYLSLVNREDLVTLSVITLWVPVGFLGPVLGLLWMSPKALYYGKGVGDLYSVKAMQLANKVCVYFALAGVLFAVGWTFHSFNLLERYGYEYSRDLTRITPTGIHLMYVKAR